MERRYKRYFVMLEAEDKSFSIVQNQVPKGYGKIEIKNEQSTLSINCQNLKTGDKTRRYRWYLINTKKEGEPTIVEIGPMEVDEKGRGEIVWEFNTENVRGSMEAIDGFNVMVLVEQNKDDRENLFIPLVGYMDKEKSTSWRYALEKHLYIPLKKEKLIKEENTVLEKIVVIEEETKQKEEAKNDVEIDKTEMVINDEIVNLEPQEEEHVYKEEFEEGIEASKEYIPIKEDVEEIFEESYALQMQGYVENALKDFLRVHPFVSNLRDYSWWQIPYNYQTIYRAYMPFILYVGSEKGSPNYHSSKMLQSIYFYKHHIFGILYNAEGSAEYYAYGIPGRNIPSEDPYEDEAFTYWHPCDANQLNTGCDGYWIVLVDTETGKIIKNL